MEHTGHDHLTCPACQPKVKDAQHLAGLRVRKVYGNVSARARREYSLNQRLANRLFDEAYREHKAGT